MAMEEPPFMLDGARVLEYVSLEGTRGGKNAYAVVSGVAVSNVAGMVMTQDLVKGHVFLIHCNDRWETLAADTYGDVESARAAAAAAYGGMEKGWTVFRALTKEEEAEVESTGRFLRELATDFPDD
jgi:hypothetical protein